MSHLVTPLSGEFQILVTEIGVESSHVFGIGTSQILHGSFVIIRRHACIPIERYIVRDGFQRGYGTTI